MVRAFFMLIGWTFSLAVPLRADDVPTVKTAKVSVEDLYDLYIYPVSLVSKKESEVYGEIVGFIKETKVKIGQTVHEGETLMLLQHTQAEYSFAPFAVKSPIAGTVAAIAKKTGARVQAGDLLVHIVNSRDLKMVFEIPQAELNLLKTGMAGEIEFRVLNEKLPLHISGISPLVKPLSGTASGELELGEISSKAREKLYPGMIGRALFKLNNRQGVVIAKDSVSFEKGKFQVRCVVDNHVVKKTVSLGKELDKKVEITSGLSAGEVLVLSASKYLKDNEEVKTEKGEPKHE